MDTRIHPRLDTRNFDHVLSQYGDVAADPAFTHARRSRQGLADAARRVHDAKAALEADKTRTKADKERVLRDTAKDVQGRATSNASKAEDALRKRARNADQQITSELKMVAPSEASEIRAHVKNMNKGERLTFLRRAIQSGDRETAAAVLAARPYLSGLDEREVSTVRAEAERAFCADTAAMRDAATAAADEIGAAAHVFFNELDKVQNAKIAEEAEQQRQASERAVQAAQRLEPFEDEPAEPAEAGDGDSGDAGDDQGDGQGDEPEAA